MWWVSCARPPDSHSTLIPSPTVIPHNTCCGVSKVLSGVCWKGEQGRECPDTKVWAMMRRPGQICFTMSSCERVPPVGPPPSPHRCSRLTAVFNGSWEFLTTIWLVPLQRTLWPASEHSSMHICTSTQRTPPAFTTTASERETGNDKLSQVNWFWAIGVIWLRADDMETLGVCFSFCFLDQNFPRCSCYWFWVRNNALVFFFFLWLWNRNRLVIFFL